MHIFPLLPPLFFHIVVSSSLSPFDTRTVQVVFQCRRKDGNIPLNLTIAMTARADEESRSGTLDSGHRPVLLTESVEALALREGDRIIDCTLGAGGHTEAILKRIGPTGRVLSIDRDPDMIEKAKHRLEQFASQITFIHANFADLGLLVKRQSFGAADGIIADLGMSSVHIDTPDRGFSFRFDASLDMRFDKKGGRPAAREVINTLSREELEVIFRTYGEERYAHRIAKQIIYNRKQKEIQTTRELAEIIVSCVPPGKQKLHPATKVFQALRVYINDELGALTRMLGSISYILVPGRRVVIISYHSLEDRIVKEFFKSHSAKCHCPPEQPICNCTGPSLRLVTRTPIVPNLTECTENPRARSAKLRIAEKVLNPDS